FGAICGAWAAVTVFLSPPTVTRNTQSILVIQPGESTQGIADDLYRRGLIRNPLAFRIWARIKGLDTHLQAGAYSITPGMNVDQIIATLQNGRPVEKRLAIIDGWRLEQIATRARALGLPNFQARDFLRYTRDPEQFPDRANYPFLRQATSMEGLLFPDTYLVPLNYSTVQVIDLML